MSPQTAILILQFIFGAVLIPAAKMLWTIRQNDLKHIEERTILVDARAERIENKLDAIDRRLSRIEGHLGVQ